MPALNLILASSSPQRRRLLEEAGYDFVVFPPEDHAECGICSTGGPIALVKQLALQKLDNVVGRLQDKAEYLGRIVVACDTVAECRGQILGKPNDEEHARAMLSALRGSVHRVYSGIALVRTDPSEDSFAQPIVDIAVSELAMLPITDDQLDAYLDSGLWQGKAGAFGFQDRHGWLRLLSGSESNVIGLPLDLLAEMLERTS